jgi:hypothetical protein
MPEVEINEALSHEYSPKRAQKENVTDTEPLE